MSIGSEASHLASTSVPGGPDSMPLLFGTSQHPKSQGPTPVLAGTSEPPVSSQGSGGTKNGSPPYLDASTADRVDKFGEVAYRHREFIDTHESMTRDESLAIRRQMYGPGRKGVQRTVTLFGRKGSHKILWMQHQEDGMTRGKDLSGSLRKEPASRSYGRQGGRR